MNLQAVLTADIVTSRKISPGKLEEKVRSIAKELEQKLFRRKKTFEFYRGDSFQAIVAPAQSLHTALLWKSSIQSIQDNGKTWDMRIAIGIGEVNHMGNKISTSTGTAFEYSGLLLDELKKKDAPRIGVRTFHGLWNQQLETECLLADTIMQRWTAAGANSIYYALLHEETQNQLASRLGIAQSSVHKRLNAANWAAIRHWDQYFQQQVLSYSETTKK